MAPKGSSAAWDHFVDIGNYIAQCKICKANLSFKGTVSNLVKHVRRKHPFMIVLVEDGESVNLQVHESTTTLNKTSSASITSSLTEIEASTRADSDPEDVEGLRSNTSITSMPTNISKNDASMYKSDIDNYIMNLFIMDFQPFQIVQHRGFRELINFAFPFYTIPSSQYFSNNLLLSRYEGLRNEMLQEVANKVQSICISCDTWTPRPNNTFLAITGHYIDIEECTMKSVLLDCLPLEGTHSPQNLSRVIKSITDEWEITNKVVLAVSDNSPNMKKALVDLGWKHYGYYSHTLNLAVTSALESSEELSDVLTRARNIVNFFKRSPHAWANLKKYQEQAGKIPKKPILDVITRWNSTFYMINRLMEMTDEINSSLYDLNSNICTLTSYDWNVLASLRDILEPCEEVTREMCGQKFVSGSLVIPITRGLKTALERTESPIPIVDIFRCNLIAEISRQFENLDHNRTFNLCMFLDPRFKLYFDDTNTADDAKRSAINLVKSLILESDSEAIKERNTTNGTITAPLSGSSSSSVWNHYKEMMQAIQPKGTAESRANIEVQRYLEDEILEIDGKSDVLQWWKDHRKSYPYLCRIAFCKLIILATSIPCEGLFTTAGLLLNERRTRLGLRKLQQLVFLHQNSK